MAQQLDQQSKAAGFIQEAVDFIARQGFANAMFEVQDDEGSDIMDELFGDEQHDVHEQQQSESPNPSKVNTADRNRSLKQGLSQSVSNVN